MDFSSPYFLSLRIHLEEFHLAVKQLNPEPAVRGVPAWSVMDCIFISVATAGVNRAGETLFPLKMRSGASLKLNPAGPRSSTSETGLFGAGTLLCDKRVTQTLGCFTCRSLLLWS